MTITERINQRIQEIKVETGYGEVTVKIQDRKVIYIEKRVGEQVKDTG